MSNVQALLNYQQADVEKQQFESALRSTESRLRLNRLHKQLKDQQTTIKKQTDELEQLSLVMQKLLSQYEAVEKRLDLENSELSTLQQDEECTAEEMTEFRQDVEKLTREITRVDKESKQLMANLEKLIAEYQRTRQTAGKQKKEYDQLRLVCEKEKSDSAAELAKIDRNMERLAMQVDPALLAKYGRARQHYNVPVVSVSNSKCSGCNMSLPMLMLKQLSANDVVVECENCGRILYGRA